MTKFVCFIFRQIKAITMALSSLCSVGFILNGLVKCVLIEIFKTNQIYFL